MRSLLSTGGLARASSRHPWRTLGIWFAIIILAGVLSSGFGGALSSSAEFTNNPESERGSELIEERLRGEEPLRETIVVTSDSATAGDAAFRSVVEETVQTLRGMEETAASVTNYYEVLAAGPNAAGSLVSEDGRTIIIPVTLAGTYDDLQDMGEEFVESAEAATGEGFEVYAVGDLSGGETYGAIAEEDMARAELFGLPIAALVLIAVFGALVAAGIPILLGLVSIFVAMGLTAALSNFLTIGDTVITMIGLAVGIDYTLFVLERYREERRHGIEKYEAIAVAGGTAGKAVLFSGLTVVLALMGMFLLPITIFQSLAAGAILAVMVAVFATQTLVPAILGLLGDRINWPRRKALSSDHARYSDGAVYGGFWGRITRTVMRHPVIAGVLAVALLVSAALPVAGLETGQASIASLPESRVKTGYEILDREFYAGVISPVQIVIDGDTDSEQVQQGIANLQEALAADGAYGPPAVEVNEADDLALVTVPMSVDPSSTAAYENIDELRGEIVPAAFGEFENNVYVTGGTAMTADFNSTMESATPWVFAFVLGLSFLLLMVAFRSIIVPLKAIIMNLLSVGAAYGMLVAVFQKGFLADELGFVQTDTIVTWIPVFLFSILFGLSMDYHVFLLSRIREHYDRTGNNAESVAVGLQSTAKIITGAALIMVAVFGAFAAGRLVEIQQMGFGLAVAVFIDATIVRAVLVPASMKLLGNWNWYMPDWLGWLPDVRIEGDPTPELAPEQAAPSAVIGD